MTEEEIALVQDSWRHVVPIADDAMKLFYSHLFELDENVATLFVGKNMPKQRTQLANALDMVVRQLEHPQKLVLPLQQLGARHVTYGVAEADFATVGQALLTTLERGLPDIWTDAHLSAWNAAWEMISTHVLSGYRSQQAA